MVFVCPVILAVLSIRKQHHIQSPRRVPSQNVTIPEYVPLREPPSKRHTPQACNPPSHLSRSLGMRPKECHCPPTGLPPRSVTVTLEVTLLGPSFLIAISVSSSFHLLFHFALCLCNGPNSSILMWKKKRSGMAMERLITLHLWSYVWAALNAWPSDVGSMPLHRWL